MGGKEKLKAMDKNEMNQFSRKGFAGSLRNAYTGIKVLAKSERNARIQIVILVLVVIAGLLLRISPAQWLAIVLVSGMVITGECFNTAVEYLSDAITTEYNSIIEKAKDVAAAGVLISAIVSVVTGLIIFIPAIFRFFEA
jgi:diacylglycerol kinase (ATP)